MQGGRFTPANVCVAVGLVKQGMGHGHPGMAGQQVLSAWCDGTVHPVGGEFNTVVEGELEVSATEHLRMCTSRWQCGVDLALSVSALCACGHVLLAVHRLFCVQAYGAAPGGGQYTYSTSADGLCWLLSTW